MWRNGPSLEHWAQAWTLVPLFWETIWHRFVKLKRCISSLITSDSIPRKTPKRNPPHVLKSVICSRTFAANVRVNGGRERNEPFLFTRWHTIQQLTRTDRMALGLWWRPYTHLAALNTIGHSFPHTLVSLASGIPYSPGFPPTPMITSYQSLLLDSLRGRPYI